MKIKELCTDERPREKMIEKGAKALSNAELLAILIRTGTGKDNAIEVARNMLMRAGGDLIVLAEMSLETMCCINGIGQSKAVAVTAAMELGKRYYMQDSKIEKLSITSAEMVYKSMRPQMKDLGHEECWVIFLNRANYIIGKEMISLGGLSSTIIDTKIVVKKAIEKQASGIILVHNHPSGSPKPGKADITATEKLKAGLEAFDISVIDHIIICDDRYFSFADGEEKIISSRETN
jgi:DNA repair protein RadC